MENRLLHTPDGVRDIYGQEYQRKIHIEQSIKTILHRYGYQDIQTPTFEYFDVFSRETGTRPSKELYKFFDKEGNTLVLRPDFTPSIARCAAKYFLEEGKPVRIMYQGNAFANTSVLQGKLRESTQIGSELIGDASAQADAETAAMVIEALRHTGLEKFQLSMGQVDYYRGLCEEAGLGEEMELELRSYISNKNYFGAEDFLIRNEIPEKFRSILLKSAELLGGYEVLQEAKKSVNSVRSLKAIERLEEIYKIIKFYGVEKYVSFDLGMLNEYQYYTGVIMKAFTYGVGDPIATGGRYDKLLGYFGKDRPAIGVMINVDSLMEAVSRQHIEIAQGQPIISLSYNRENYAEVIKEAQKRRMAGENIVLVAED